MVETRDISREVEALKKDVKSLQEDLSEMINAASSYSKEKLAESRERLRVAIGDISGQVRERAAQTCDAVRQCSSEAVDRSRQTIEHRPITSVLIAFVAGTLLGKLVMRLCK